MQLQKDIQQIQAGGVQVVGVSYDSVEVLKRFSDKQDIEFLLLSDAASKTIDAYGLRNTSIQSGSRSDGIPYPATIVIDAAGVVRANLPGTTRERHSTAALVQAAKKLAN